MGVAWPTLSAAHREWREQKGQIGHELRRKALTSTRPHSHLKEEPSVWGSSFRASSKTSI